MEKKDTFYIIEIFARSKDGDAIQSIELNKVLIYDTESEANAALDPIMDELFQRKDLKIVNADNGQTTTFLKNNKICLCIHTFKSKNWKQEDIMSEVEKLIDYKEDDDNGTDESTTVTEHGKS